MHYIMSLFSFLSPVGWKQAAIVADLLAAVAVVADVQQVHRKTLQLLVAQQRALHLN
jgi:hypothetical protein